MDKNRDTSKPESEDKRSDGERSEHIARWIAEQLGRFSLTERNEGINLIATALREYAEQECRRVLAGDDHYYAGLIKSVREEADTEGFKRGREEGFKQGQANCQENHG